MFCRHILSDPGQIIGCGGKTGDVVVVAWEEVVSEAVVVSAALVVTKLVARVVSLMRSVKAAVVVSDAELSMTGTIFSMLVAEIVSGAENDMVCVRDILVSALTLVSVSMAAMAVVMEEVPGLHSPAAAMPAKTGRASNW